MVTDPIADFLTSVRNAARAGKVEIRVPHSRIKSDIAHVFKNEGYLREVELVKEGNKRWLRLELKVDAAKRAITGIRRVSRPGLRRYVEARGIPRVLGGLGVSVISTSRGVMSGREARKENVGGEVLCYIW